MWNGLVCGNWTLLDWMRLSWAEVHLGHCQKPSCRKELVSQDKLDCLCIKC